MATGVQRQTFKLLLIWVLTVSSSPAQQPTESLREGQDKPLRAGVNGVTAPKCVHCPAPHYTKEARKVNFNGIVLLDVTVTTEGKVIDPVVLKSPGLGLNEQAFKQLQKWKMSPALNSNGNPVNCRVQIEVTFHRDPN